MSHKIEDDVSFFFLMCKDKKSATEICEARMQFSHYLVEKKSQLMNYAVSYSLIAL